MVYAAAYMLVSGMKLIMSRLMSERRVFVVGISVTLGLTPALVPGIFSEAPELLKPILESPLAVGSFCAIILTQLFRWGAAQRNSVQVELAADDSEMLQELRFNKAIRGKFVDLGSAAGASRQVIDRATDVTSELVAFMKHAGCIQSAVTVDAAFEDSRLLVALAYVGTAPPLEKSNAASAAHNDGSADIFRRLRDQVDRLTVRTKNARQELSLVFEP